MSAPDNLLAFDLDVARRAARHWDSAAAARKRKLEALRHGRLDEVEPMDRLAKRVNHLVDKVRDVPFSERENLPETLKQLVNKNRIEEDEIDSPLVERVIGETRDFLSVEFIAQAQNAIRSVGRVVTRIGNGRVSYGTGFMVSPRLLMTNHHVLPSAEVAARSRIEFDFQRDLSGRGLAVQPFDLDPAAFFLADRDLDFALVAVNPRPSGARPLEWFGHQPLIGSEGKIMIGEPINIVQHPKGEMKQIVIRENRLLDLPEEPDTVAHYEADTEPGSSGSPVFSDAWEIIALHHSGVPRTNGRGQILDVDGRVWRDGDDPTRIDWVANEGIRVSRLVRFIAEARLGGPQRALRDGLLDAKRPLPEIEDGPPEPAPAPGPEQPRPETADPAPRPSDGAVTVTIPLSITVRLGEVATHPGAAIEVGAAVGALERIDPDPDYANRPGYDPDFLGFPVPLPRLTNTIRTLAARLDGAGEVELKYHHYSVVMNGERRLAFFAAGNFDAGAAVRHERDGNDRWFFDPRIGRDLQAGNEFYASNPLDRGHLFRRADGAWGATAEEAKLANDDTFHWANCSPQHEVFNQGSQATRRSLRLWGNLEDHIAAEAGEDNRRLSIFSGPVFRDHDRAHRGLRVPREYWKIVVFEAEDGKPRALAFLLSQAALISTLPRERFEVGEYDVFQVKVREVEHRTKLDFGDLSGFDPLESPGVEERFEASSEAVPLRDLADMIL